MDWRAWLYGLGVAVVSGAADGFLLNFVDPATFNMTTGLKALLTLCLLFGLKAGAFYLKTHPLPTTTTIVTSTGGEGHTTTTVKVESASQDGDAKPPSGPVGTGR